MLYGYSHLIKLHPFVLEGVVVDSLSGEPIENVYVFIIKGKEEALTNSHGHFRIECWQKLPVLVTAERIGYEICRILVTDKSARGEVFFKIKPSKID